VHNSFLNRAITKVAHAYGVDALELGRETRPDG
jgi:hypothetical protein